MISSNHIIQSNSCGDHMLSIPFGKINGALKICQLVLYTSFCVGFGPLMHYWMNFSKIDQKYQAVVIVAALGVLSNLGYMLLRELHDRKKYRALHLFVDLGLQVVPVALITEDSGATSPFVIMGWVAVLLAVVSCVIGVIDVKWPSDD